MLRNANRSRLLLLLSLWSLPLPSLCLSRSIVTSVCPNLRYTRTHTHTQPHTGVAMRALIQKTSLSRKRDQQKNIYCISLEENKHYKMHCKDFAHACDKIFDAPRTHTYIQRHTHSTHTQYAYSTHTTSPVCLPAIKAINFAMTLHYGCSLQPASASPRLPYPSPHPLSSTPISLSCQCFLHDLMRNFQNFANFSDNLSFLHQAAKSSLLAPAVSTFSVCPLFPHPLFFMI